MHLELDKNELRPIVELVVDEVLEKCDRNEAKLDKRIAYTEREAANLLGIPQHSLRDCRLRKEIKASRLGRRIVYSRDELLDFLRRHEID